MASPENILADKWPPNTIYYYDASGNVEYVCKHEDLDGISTTADWLCWKYSYVSGNLFRKQGPRVGAADSAPSALGWTF